MPSRGQRARSGQPRRQPSGWQFDTVTRSNAEYSNGTFDYDRVTIVPPNSGGNQPPWAFKALGVYKTHNVSAAVLWSHLTSQDLKVDLLVENVHLNSRPDEVEKRLADVLHLPPFSRKGEPKMNFDFFMPKNTQNRDQVWSSHNGFGYPTLPGPEHVLRFMECYGPGGSGKPIVVHGCRLTFNLSTRHSARGKVEMLLRTNYVAACERQHRAREEEKLCEELLINSVQFGRVDWSGVFVVEHTVNFQRDGFIGLNLPKDQIGISSRTGQRTCIISAKHVFALIHDSEGPSVLFLCENAPAFELKPCHPSDDQQEERVLRERVGGFDAQHEKTAAFSPCHIRITFHKISVFETFVRFSKHTGLPNDIIRQHLVSTSPHYNRFKAPFKVVYQWQESLAANPGSLDVCLHLEKILTNLILSPKDLAAIKPALSAMADENPKLAAYLLQHLAAKVVEKHGPGFRRGEWLAPNLEELVELARRSAEAVLATSLEGVSSAWHLVFTPTTRILKGPYMQISNRMTRLHPEHMMRVSFLEEDQTLIYPSREIDMAKYFESRIRTVFADGFKLANQRWEYLAYSQSGLSGASI